MSQLDTLLQAEKARLDEERQTLQERIAAGERRLQEIRVRLRHVEALLGTSEDAETVPTAAKASSAGRSLMDMVEGILGERSGDPMHYKELAREVQERGGELSGDNAASSLVARLVDDERFVRPVRKGFYALRKDYPNAKNVGARKRHRGSS